MEKEEKIHQLANCYFDGKISLNDEQVLYNFISQNKKNKALFRNWENDWIVNNAKGNTLQKEWSLLQSKIQTRKAITLLSKAKRFTVSKRIAAAAAVAIISIASTLFIQNLLSLPLDKKVFSIETSRGGKNRIILPDGTVAWLNSLSKISYSSLFGSSERELELDGEAYFEVAKQDEIPFRVKTLHYDIVVKGTKFNISSYSNDDRSTTTLMEGRVEVIHQNKILEMNPGESIQMDMKTHEFTKTHVNSEQYKSWIENRIEYDAITLNELFKRLSRQYNVNIYFEPTPQENRMLNISIQNNESIDEILNGISNVMPIVFDKKNNEIYVKLEKH